MPVTDQMKGIPMGELIGGPLTASCDAQYRLANAMIDFVMSIGFDKGKTKTLDFDLERPVDSGGGNITKETVHIQAPLLGLVPVPALLVDLVQIDFTMEVKDHAEAKSAVQSEVNVSAHAGFGPWGASMTGKVSTNRENTRSTDNSAKYNFHVQARQQPATEGMSKLMDLLSSAVEPIKSASGGGG